MTQANLTLLDTNILIEILKNNQTTIEQVESLGNALGTSVITAMELLYGARDKRELKQLEQFIELFQIIHIEPNISKLSLKLVSKFAKSHTLDIPDSLIAASCLYYKANLLTYNTKDFKFIPEIMLS